MAFKLFVPPLGTQVVLTHPWDFRLYNEDRNGTLMTLLGDARDVVRYDPQPSHATLPPGTELIIDRYYIKNGLSDFDSVSFRMKGVSAVPKSRYASEKLTKRQVRFWAKLDDVNTMQVEVVPAEA
jgi:hypothetical protein